MEFEEEELKAKDIPVMCEFPDVFLKELPRSPPQLGIDFEIELVSGAQPILKAPYRVTPFEHKEL